MCYTTSWMIKWRRPLYGWAILDSGTQALLLHPDNGCQWIHAARPPSDASDITAGSAFFLAGGPAGNVWYSPPTTPAAHPDRCGCTAPTMVKSCMLYHELAMTIKEVWVTVKGRRLNLRPFIIARKKHERITNRPPSDAFQRKALLYYNQRRKRSFLYLFLLLHWHFNLLLFLILFFEFFRFPYPLANFIRTYPCILCKSMNFHFLEIILVK